MKSFEYALFSENVMVRRAATEAINNLIPAPEVSEWFANRDKMKIWLLFAKAVVDDLATARAAMGAIANLADQARARIIRVDQPQRCFANRRSGVLTHASAC